MISVGSVTITPLFEVDASRIVRDCITDATPEAIRQIDWLMPQYADKDGTLRAQVQSFLIKANGQNIVVDTCVGNGRDRPELSAWAKLQTDFFDRFSRIVAPSKVDIVICTHLHFDHVGWNTILRGGQWAPTFPNAQYLFSEEEFRYWNSRPTAEVLDDHNGFAESVLPIYEAGLAKLVPADYRLSNVVSLIPTPGHTPGHVSVLLQSEGQRAIITGDVLHHPCQIAHPEWKTIDTDSDKANRTRRQLLERFADTDMLFIGSHFAGQAAGRIIRNGKEFQLICITRKI